MQLGGTAPRQAQLVRRANGTVGIVWGPIIGAAISAAGGIAVGLLNRSISQAEQAEMEAFEGAQIAAAKVQLHRLKAQKTLLYVGVAGAVAIMLMKG